MENIIKRAIDVNLKSNTELLIDYLEAVIADEMILNSFIRAVEIIHQTNTEIVIATHSSKGLEVIEENYAVFFKDAAKNVYQKNMSIRYVVSPKNFGDVDKVVAGKYISSKFTFKNYVEGDFNKEALKMAKKIVEVQGVYSPLFITSPSGLGKTHLLHAIGNDVVIKGLSVRYVEPNNFTKNISELARIGGNSISTYIDKFLTYDVLLFDDIQNLGDRSVTLKVLFQILNEFIERNKQIVLVSDKSPVELSGFESRFITRFTSGLTTKITHPSDEDLIKILRFKLKAQKLSPEKWEKEALKFVVRNNSTSIRSIEGAVKRVSFYIEDVENVKYTYTVISNIFKELSIDPEELTPQRIIKYVGNYYKISKTEIIGKSRKANIMIARHMAIWLMRKILDMSFKEIGKMFGNRDHSTIIASIKIIDKKMAMNDIVKTAADRIEKNIKSVV